MQEEKNSTLTANPLCALIESVCNNIVRGYREDDDFSNLIDQKCS